MVNLSTHLDYRLGQLAEIVQGELHGHGVEDRLTEHVLLDSRQVIYPASSLFIALKGRQSDGHTFIPELYRKGVRSFLVSQLPANTGIYPDAAFLKVENTQAAFHRLAAFHRRRFHLEVVGITGSNGKTIVKEWLHQLLSEDFSIVRSPRSFNSQTGVPLSVLQINEGHQLGLFEAGISLPGEMEKLEAILKPDVVIFTNIGEAHSEGFPDLKTKLSEKLKLIKGASIVIYRRDKHLIHEQMRQQAQGGQRFFSWALNSKEPGANVYFQKIVDNSSHRDFHRLLVSVPEKGLEFKVTVPFPDEASVENACHCMAFLLCRAFDVAAIQSRVVLLEPVAMRLELKEGVNDCTIINDSYNSDLTSLAIALDFLDQQNTALKKTLILSDVLQSGMKADELYRKVASLVAEKQVKKIVGVGKEVSLLSVLLPENIEQHYFANTGSLLEAIDSLRFFKEIILLKGARLFEFEKVANRLSSRVHNTVLEVNMGALLHNLRTYQGLLRPGTRLMVMVKAGAYGSGSVEVAKLLEFQHVDYLGVAYADEGVELRKKGIQLPIMVMNPEAATFEALIRHDLEPEVYSLNLLSNFIQFLNGRSQKGKNPIGIHVKIDTGMHRLGFDENEIEALATLLCNHPEIKVLSVFSHLAASEDQSHDPFTHLQVERFTRMYARLADSIGYRPVRHLLNSTGIVRFPQWQMDMVRLGLGLYGLDSSGLLSDKLQVVNTLKATVSQVKMVQPGESVGYGRKAVADRPMKIATISIGYADGLLRRTGQGCFSVLIKGRRAPLVGNVCMDMAMADVSKIEDVTIGDEVLVFGEEPKVEELAQCLDTIPYEIFTSISQRVKRTYIQE